MECVNGKLSGNSILISITRIPINSKFIVFRGKYILLYNIKCKKQLSKQVIKKHKKNGPNVRVILHLVVPSYNVKP